MLPPANRSKKPKIEPAFELMNSSHLTMLMPGVGMWPPSRYTANIASANSSRLRRSGTRNMFVNASNSLFMTPFDLHRYSVLAPITCAVPPDAWIFSSADLEKWWASTVILRVNKPVPRIFRPSRTLWITPVPSRPSTVNVSPSSFSSWPRLTMANCFLKMLVNPRFGRRRCSGIWPPSNPRFWLKPVPARWPLEPRVAVLPCPEPMPRPIRFRPFTWPAGGFNPLRFISVSLLDHLQQVRNFLDHAAEDRRVRTLYHLVQLAQTQALHHALLLLGNRVRAAVEFNLDLAFHVGSLSTTWLLQFIDGQAAHVGHRTPVAQRFQRHDGRLHHVVRVAPSDGFGQHVGHAARRDHRAHRAAGDHAGSGRGRLQQHLATGVLAEHPVGDGGFQYVHLAQVLLGGFDSLADRRRHFLRLADPVAHHLRLRI